MKRTPLKRLTALAPKPMKRAASKLSPSGLTSSTPGRGRTKRPADTGPDMATRALILLRDGGCCVVCHEAGHELQHRLARKSGGSSDPAINSPANLITVCRDCHRYMESFRLSAESYGWVVRLGVTPPSLIPVMWFGRWVLLLHDGTFEPCLAPPHSFEGDRK